MAETWQGQSADTVTVQLVTGPIGDSRGITFSGAPRLEVGEETILHLRYPDFAGDAEAEKLGLSLCTNNAAPSDCLVVLATPVRGTEVLDSYGQRPTGQLADLRRRLQLIAAILDKEHFYQKAF